VGARVPHVDGVFKAIGPSGSRIGPCRYNRCASGASFAASVPDGVAQRSGTAAHPRTARNLSVMSAGSWYAVHGYQVVRELDHHAPALGGQVNSPCALQHATLASLSRPPHVVPTRSSR
jgi:hypothetical protein